MFDYWTQLLGAKACAWTGNIAAAVWPQTSCNVDEAWNMGTIVIGAFAALAFLAVYRRLYAWHSYYSR
jgi:hypothetical protein